MIKPIFISCALLLTACTAKPPILIDASCTSFQPIRPSRADTEETLRQVLSHNRMWENLCHD